MAASIIKNYDSDGFASTEYAGLSSQVPLLMSQGVLGAVIGSMVVISMLGAIKHAVRQTLRPHITSKA